jgi:hypothetical protein
MKELVTEQLRHLSHSLSLLQRRVREAVAGEVSRAVADAVAEVLDQTLRGPRALLKRPTQKPDWFDPYDPSEWPDLESRDWQKYMHPPHHQPERSTSMTPSDAEGNSSMPAALALAMTTGRWWLTRRGSPWGAAGVGLLVGGAMLAGGPLVRTALGALWAIDRLLSTTEAIGDGAKLLIRRTDE